ncbi:MAG: LysM peptidoglycan-binding domain-containing protein [Pseudomonadota bacterium]
MSVSGPKQAMPPGTHSKGQRQPARYAGGVLGLAATYRAELTLSAFALATAGLIMFQPAARQTAEDLFAAADTEIEMSVTRAANLPMTITDLPADAAVLTSLRPVLRPDSALDGIALRARLATAPIQTVHTVRLGDSLPAIALRYYGDTTQAHVIFEANRRHLGDSGDLSIGQLLRIPDLNNL